MDKKTSISFEFFPPQTDAGLLKLTQTAKYLEKHQPDYVSVTFGAGGSTQNNTIRTVEAISQQTQLSVAPHLSCVGTTKKQVDELLARYQSMGVARLVVLRGDLPSGFGHGGGDFNYAVDLVRYIRETTGDNFYIYVAIYPECHPMAGCMQTDLKYFKQKIEAGANEAITQYFYCADAYEALLDSCEKNQIDVPITPGIMPMTNYSQLARFSERCGAEIPRWIVKRLIGYGDDIASIKAFGLEVVSNLCEKLIQLGAPDLHFYTLNKAEPTEAVIAQLIQTKEKQYEVI